MALTSLKFFAFAAVLIILYFVVPKKFQWWVLLAGSLFFYLMTGWKNIFYILFTSASTYGAARWIEHVSHNKQIEKQKRKLRKRLILTVTLLLNFGLLGFFKYLNFFIEQLNRILRAGGADPMGYVSLVVPLGISFYTFQTMGYLIDVYWEKTEAQKNYPKLLLFTSFFPQIIQGPISDYRQLSRELYAEHRFSYDRFARGVQRFAWGFLKKAVCADVAAHCVKVIFTYYDMYYGAAVLIGVFLYSINIYADFSGYMDMVCGLCEVLGIKLAENFERPYFSKSIAEYWRRWHITLGAWFKNYIYYPIAMSKTSRKIAKSIKAKAGKRIGDAVPSTIALIVTWFVTGLWHGATWAYIVWGLVNGFFLILQVWLDPFYAWCRKKLHVKETGWPWKLFTVARTFALISFIKVLPEVGSLSDGWNLIRSIFVGWFFPWDFKGWFPYSGDMINLCFMATMIVLIFVTDLIQRKRPVRDYFNRLPMIVRIALVALAFVIAISFGVRTDSGDFMYANF